MRRFLHFNRRSLQSFCGAVFLFAVFNIFTAVNHLAQPDDFQLTVQYMQKINQHRYEISDPAESQNCTRSSNPYCLREPIRTLIIPNKICSDDPQDNQTLLLVTTSTVGNRAMRDLQRSHMMTNARLDVRRIFVLGVNNASDQRHIAEEANIYGDILQGDIAESYRNIVLKTIMALVWFRDHCLHFQYYMKTDDDIAINLEAMLDYVESQDLHKPFLMGKCIQNRTVTRSKLFKHYISHEQYVYDQYPPFCEGSGYLMPSQVARDLANASFLAPVLPIEDTFSGIAITRLPYPVAILNRPEKFSSNYWVMVQDTMCTRLSSGELFTLHCAGGSGLSTMLECTRKTQDWTSR